MGGIFEVNQGSGEPACFVLRAWFFIQLKKIAQDGRTLKRSSGGRLPRRDAATRRCSSMSF